MRLAIVIGSDYQQSSQVPPLPRSPEDADRIATFLDQSDGETFIEELTADRRFAELMERVFDEQPHKIESLIVYFSGYVVTASGREPSLLLDGERLGAYSLPRLARLVETRSPRTLFIVDALSVAYDGAEPTEVALSIGESLAAHTGIGALVSVVALAEAQSQRASFTDLVLFCWETALKSDAAESEFGASELFEMLRAEAAFDDLPVVRHFPGATDFPILHEPKSEPEQEVSGLRLAERAQLQGFPRGPKPSVPKTSSLPPPLPPPLPGLPGPEVLRVQGALTGLPGGAPLVPLGSELKPEVLAPPLPPALLPPAGRSEAPPPPSPPTLPPAGRSEAPPPPLPPALLPAAGRSEAPPPPLPPALLPAAGRSEAPPPPVAAPPPPVVKAPATPPSLPPPLIADARHEQLSPQAKTLQAPEPGLEEELTEPGHSLETLGEEATNETPPEATPDTERELEAAPRETVRAPTPRTEADVLSGAAEIGFAEGEDTDVTEGLDALAELVGRARQGRLSAPAAERPAPSALPIAISREAIAAVAPPEASGAISNDSRPVPRGKPESQPPAAEALASGSSSIALLVEESLADEALPTRPRSNSPLTQGASIADLVEESLASEGITGTRSFSAAEPIVPEPAPASEPGLSEVAARSPDEAIPSFASAVDSASVDSAIPDTDRTLSPVEPLPSFTPPQRDAPSVPDSQSGDTVPLPLPSFGSAGEGAEPLLPFGTGNTPMSAEPAARLEPEVPMPSFAMDEEAEGQAEPLPSFGTESAPLYVAPLYVAAPARLEPEVPMPSFAMDEEAEGQPEPLPSFGMGSAPAYLVPPAQMEPEAPMPSFAMDEEEQEEPPEPLPWFGAPSPAHFRVPPTQEADEPMPSFAMDEESDDSMPSFATDLADDTLGALPPPPVLARPMTVPSSMPPPSPGVRSPLPPPFPRAGGGATEAEAEAALPEALLPEALLPEQLPPYEACLASGDALLDASDHVGAREAYEKALAHAQADQAGVVYARLGAVCRARGDYDGAVMNYEIALELLPGDLVPVTALTDLFVAQREFATVERYQRRYLEAQTEPEARAQVWQRLAVLWRDQADDLARHRNILLEWAEDQPDTAAAHEALLESYEQADEQAAAVETERRLARISSEPARKAYWLSRASHRVLANLSDAEQALTLVLEALHAYPKSSEALELARTLLEHQARWEELARLYEQISAKVDDAKLHAELGARLGAIYEEKLGAPERTITAYERVLEEDPTRHDLRRKLVDLYTKRGEPELALLHCRRALREQPSDSELYRKVYALLDRVGETDAAWNAAMVLDCLGEADINEQLVADAHRPTGLLAAKDTVPEDFWGHGLFAPERDLEFAEILAAVLETAVELRASFLKKRKRAPRLEPDKRHDPHTSTTTLAKSLLWTSKLLSVKPPELYVLDEVPGDLSAAPIDTPSAMVSKSLGRGLSLSQLAFLWGRHLTLFRPEHYLAVFCPTTSELVELVEASLIAGECPAMAERSASAEAKRFAKDLKKKLHPGSFERLRSACRTFRVEGLEERARHWLRTVELAGGRAGLLACGDLSIAAELVRRHPVRGQTLEEDQVSDLMCFSISDEYAKLRGRLGVAIA